MTDSSALDHGSDTKFIWIDLEMTGLDARNDVITEVAMVITGPDMQELAMYESGVQHSPETLERLFTGNKWYMSQSQVYRQASVNKSLTGLAPEIVESQILALLNQHGIQQGAILAGNTIRADRSFIDRYWPNLAARLHYRMLDVSSFKVLFQARYGIKHEKANEHHALADIRESMQELQTYTDYIQKEE